MGELCRAQERAGGGHKVLCLSLPCPHTVSTTGHTEAEPSQGKQGEHTHTNLGGSINTFLLALRIPEYLVLTKKPLRAVEPKTKLRNGRSRLGFRGLLYQSSPHSATLRVYIHLFIFIPFKHLHYSRLCCNKNTAFEIHSSDREISLKMLAMMKNTTCKLCPT